MAERFDDHLKPELGGDVVQGVLDPESIFMPSEITIQRAMMDGRRLVVMRFDWEQGPFFVPLPPESALRLAATLEKHGRISLRKQRGDRQ